jgi:GrpB-like predicted nucleotidyltransferase (UPF0157 family)
MGSVTFSRLPALTLAGRGGRGTGPASREGQAARGAVTSARVGLRDPDDAEAYDELLSQITVGGAQPLAEPIRICDYDPAWVKDFEREASRVREALGDRVLRLEHVGSTSVPGLAAKPVIDMVLEVPDASDEPAYAGALDAAGYVLHIREDDWLAHRLFRTAARDVQLHVFSAGCPEADRMVRFRDWLRSSGADRELYARRKRELAGRDWTYMQQYADAKTDVVSAIMARAEAGGSS